MWTFRENSYQPKTQDRRLRAVCFCHTMYSLQTVHKQEVKVIWQKAPHGGPIPRLVATPGGLNLYHWILGVGVPISVP